MATVYAGSGDAWRRNVDTVWATARGSAGVAGNSGSSTFSNYAFSVMASYSGGRGGNAYYCGRAYLPFDLSSESGTIASAYLSFYASENTGSGSSGGDFARVIAIQATALNDSNDDHGNCFSSGTTLGTILSAPAGTTVSSTAGWHSFVISIAGMTAMQSLIGSGTFTVCLMAWYFDYHNNAPSLGGDATFIKVDYSEGSNDPYLTINYSAAVTHNATFFGANF